jgi:hypothetical protein
VIGRGNSPECAVFVLGRGHCCPLVSWSRGGGEDGLQGGAGAGWAVKGWNGDWDWEGDQVGGPWSPSASPSCEQMGTSRWWTNRVYRKLFWKGSINLGSSYIKNRSATTKGNKLNNRIA